MQCHRQFDDAEPGAEMAASDGDRIDRLPAQLVGHLPQLTGLEAPEVLGSLDLVEQWGLRRNRHATLLLQTNEFLRPRFGRGLRGSNCDGKQIKPPTPFHRKNAMKTLDFGAEPPKELLGFPEAYI